MTTRRTWLFGSAFALLAGTLGGFGGSPAVAGGNGKGPQNEVDECVYAMHGSPAAEAAAAAEEAREARGGGTDNARGGPKTPSCSKTFAKWTKSALSVWIDATGGPGAIDAVTFTDYVKDGLTEWACHSGLGNTTTISYATSASGADVTVGWGDLGSTGILGQAATSYFGGVISHSTITMNSNQQAFVWTAGPTPSIDVDGCGVEATNGVTTGADYDFLSVITHEIGHSLGIAHPNNRCRSNDACYAETMYSCTASEEWMRRELNPGDEASITSLYGSQP